MALEGLAGPARAPAALSRFRPGAIFPSEFGVPE